MILTDQELLTAAYDAFNRRDIEAALATMHPDVEWPNAIEGGTLRGHSAVRDYWSRQWTTIDPHVEPRGFSTDRTGRTIVEVHQVVHDQAGAIVIDQIVQHVYHIEHGLVRSMEIRTP